MHTLRISSFPDDVKLLVGCDLHILALRLGLGLDRQVRVKPISVINQVQQLILLFHLLFLWRKILLKERMLRVKS